MARKRLETVGPICREYRRRSGLSAAQVAKSLKEKYGYQVSPKTIYGWENGVSHMSVSEFIYLCEIYGVEDLSVFWKGAGIASAEHPMLEADSLLEKYLESRYREAIDRLLGIEADEGDPK